MRSIADILPIARTEVATKTCAQIALETSLTWAARAVASWEQFRATQDIRWYAAMCDFRHEAIEHAAEGPPGTLEMIKTQLEGYLQ